MKIITYTERILLLLITALFTSCQLNGELDEGSIYYKVTAKWYYYGGDESDIHTVKIIRKSDGFSSDTAVIGSLGQDDIISESITFANTSDDFTTCLILEKQTDSVPVQVLDTAVILSGAKTFSLLQITETGSPVLFGGYDTSDEEAPDSSGLTKYNYYYSEESLPDSVKLVFYLYDEDIVEPAKDSLTVYESEFSEYITLEQGYYLFQIKDASDDSVIQDIKILGSSLPVTTVTGYSAALSETGYKFVTAILYEESTKYKDKILFSEEW